MQTVIIFFPLKVCTTNPLCSHHLVLDWFLTNTGAAKKTEWTLQERAMTSMSGRRIQTDASLQFRWDGSHRQNTDLHLATPTYQFPLTAVTMATEFAALSDWAQMSRLSHRIGAQRGRRNWSHHKETTVSLLHGCNTAQWHCSHCMPLMYGCGQAESSALKSNSQNCKILVRQSDDMESEEKQKPFRNQNISYHNHW